MSTKLREIAVQALKELWQELKFEGDPIIFISPMQRKVQLEHHPLLLHQLVANGKQRKKSLLDNSRVGSYLMLLPMLKE